MRLFFYFALSCFLLLTGCASAGPGISRDRIPESISGSMRNSVKKLYLRNPVQRANGVMALGRMGPDALSAVPFLVGMLNDASQLVMGCNHGLSSGKNHGRAISPGDRAAVALADIAGTRETEPVVIAAISQAMDDGTLDFRGRFNAVLALEKISSLEARKLLVCALHDPVFPVRIRAASALGNLKEHRAIAALCEARSDSHPDVRKKVRKALLQITGQKSDKACAAMQASPVSEPEHGLVAFVCPHGQ